MNKAKEETGVRDNGAGQKCCPVPEMWQATGMKR